MRKANKFIAGALTLAMVVPAFTACGKKNSEDVISASDPWYDCTAVEVGENLDPADYEYGYIEFCGFCDLGYVYELEAVRTIPEGFDMENSSELYDYSVIVYDISGNKVTQISLSDKLHDSDLGGYASVGNVKKIGDVWYVMYEDYNMDTGTPISYRAELDLSAGTIGDLEEMAVPDNIADIVSEGYEESSYNIGEYEIRKFWMSGDNPSYVILVTDGAGNVNVFDMRELFPNQPIYDISNVIDTGNGKVVIYGYYNSTDLYYELDFATMQISELSSDMTWLEEEIDDLCVVEGVGSAIVNDDGVYSVDFDSQTINPIFMFSDTNVNQYDVSNFTAVKVTEDECIFTGTSSVPTVGSASMLNTSALIYTFTRADSNPNAGKTIIEVASVDNLDYALCNAVCEFNNNSSDYFIRLTTKYNLYKYNDDSGEDNEMAAADNASANLSNQLAIDLMAGEGPDIIMNASELNMLNNPDYLLDMSEFVSTNFSSDAYFTNIFEAYKTNGALYQIPLCVSVVGISTSADNVADDQIGFTFEQYEEFVSGPCNGESPFSGNQIDVFIQLADCMQDSFITDGQVNFDTPEFRALAEFTAANINNSLENEDDYYDYGYYSEDEDGAASISYISDINGYFTNIINKNNRLLGLPSSDGRGPVIYESDSVAISAMTQYPDACREFVSVLLGESSQDIYAAYEIPVNRASFNTISVKCIEGHNSEIELMLRIYDEALLNSFGYDTQLMDESNIPAFEEFVDSIDSFYINDASINAIIREEMPSFFEGQKSLDQIIPVLNDRVSTVLTERN